MAACTKCGHAAGAEMLTEKRDGWTRYYFACLRCRDTKFVTEVSDEEKAEMEAELRADDEAEEARRAALTQEERDAEDAAEDAWLEEVMSTREPGASFDHFEDERPFEREPLIPGESDDAA